jgi:SOS-response transcriptional repressor LexA
VQAGAWTDVVDSYQPGDADEFLLTDMELSSNAFALEIKGDSMLPEFKPGDRVIIDPAVCPQPGDYVVAKNGEDEATFKKYRPRGVSERGDLVFELVPLNEDYPSMRSDVTPIRIVGTMVEHRKYRRR